MKETLIRKTFVDFIYRYLKLRGIDTTVLESRYPLLPAEADGLDPSLSMAQYFRLFEEAVEITHDPDIGLHIGQGMEWADFGAFGYAYMNASTVAEVLEINTRYQSMVQTNTNMTLEREPDGSLVYCYLLLDDLLPVNRQDNDFAMAGFLYLLRDLTCKQDWSPSEVHFNHSQPADITAYQQLFGCPVKFDMPCSKLYVDTAMARTPIIGGDSKLFGILEAELKRLNVIAGNEDKLLQTVQQAVANTLSNHVPTIESIASSLSMGKRTLQRRLGESGQTFNGVLEDTRKQLALRYLESSNYPLVEIAFLLGYSELSTFSRAFRRWTGDTPQHYRQKNPSRVLTT